MNQSCISLFVFIISSRICSNCRWQRGRVRKVYNQSEATIVKIPKKGIKAIQGDWNSKTGSDAHTNWAGMTSKFGVGITNKRHIRMLEFVRTNKMVITSIRFNHTLWKDNMDKPRWKYKERNRLHFPDKKKKEKKNVQAV